MRLSIVTFAKYHDVTPDFYAIIDCKKYDFSRIFFFFRLRICVYLCFILLYTIIICVLFYYILLQMCFFGAVDDDSVVNKGMVSDSTVHGNGLYSPWQVWTTKVHGIQYWVHINPCMTTKVHGIDHFWYWVEPWFGSVK